MANRNFANSRIYTGHVMPVLIDCNFVVAASDTAGLGITSLKGPYVKNVFMHTTYATPSTLPSANPAAGTIVIQLDDNYNRIYGITSSIISPPGTPVVVTSSLTIGVAYEITTVGDATAADWLALGLPRGVTPAIGASFISLSTGTGAATVTRVAPSAAAGSAVMSIEMIANPNASLAPDPTANQGFGAQIILQCRNVSGALAAPAAGSIINIAMLLSNSSVLIAGE